MELKRGRPLFLSPQRWRALCELWLSNGVPQEVARIRNSSDRVIKADYY